MSVSLNISQNIRNLTRRQIINFVFYLICLLAVFGLLLATAVLMLRSVWASYFYLSYIGHGTFGIIIYLIVLLFCTLLAFATTRVLVTQYWSAKFNTLNERVISQINDLANYRLGLPQYERKHEEILLFHWDGINHLASLQKHKVFSGFDGNNWNLETLGRIISKFDLENEIQDLFESNQIIHGNSISVVSDGEVGEGDSKQQVGSLRSKAKQLYKAKIAEAEQNERLRQLRFQAVQKEAQNRTFEAISRFKNNLGELCAVIHKRLSNDILNAAQLGRPFPYEFKLESQDINLPKYSAVKEYLGSTIEILNWFSAVGLIPKNLSLTGHYLHNIRIEEGRDFYNWHQKNKYVAGVMQAKLLDGWVTETLLRSRSAQKLANFAKKNELQINITIDFWPEDTDRSLIKFAVHETGTLKDEKDLTFETVFFSSRTRGYV